MTYRSTPSDLWMPLFGIDTPEARAERLRRMLENVPWKMATELYGSPLALELRVAQMRAELAEIETQIERGEVEELPEDPYLRLVAARCTSASVRSHTPKRTCGCTCSRGRAGSSSPTGPITAPTASSGDTAAADPTTWHSRS